MSIRSGFSIPNMEVALSQINKKTRMIPGLLLQNISFRIFGLDFTYTFRTSVLKP